MLLLDNTAPLIDKDPAPDAEQVDLLQEDPGIDEHTASYHEIRFRIDKTRGNHPDTILFISDTDGMPGIRADTAPGDDGWSILVSDVRHDLSFPLVTKESADDNSTGHYSIK